MLVRIPLSYAAPDPLNGFDGVEVQLEAPAAGDDPVTYTSGKVYPRGWHRWTENPGEIILRVPYPKRDERWYVYAVSRNPSVVALWKHRSDGAPTPYVQVDISKNPGGGGTIAPNVTGVTAEADFHTLHRARAGQKRFSVFIQWTLPTAHADYAALDSLRVAIVNDDTGVEEWTFGSLPVDREQDLPVEFRTATLAAPGEVKTYKVRVYAINVFGQVSASPAESGTFLVGPFPDAPAVDNAAADVGYAVQGALPMFRFELSWDLPTGDPDYDDGFEGVEIFARPTGSAVNWTSLATEAAGVTERNTDYWPRPAEDSDWDIKFVPFNPALVREESNAVTISPVTVLAAGSAPNVTGFSAARKTAFNEAGIEMFGFSGSWTNPVNDDFDGVIVTATLSGESHEHILAIEREGSTSFNTDFWPAPDSSKTYTIRAWAINRAGRRTSSPANQNVAVTPGASGALKLTRAALSTVGPGLSLTGSDVRANPGSGLEISGSTVRVDTGAGLGFSGNDLRIAVTGVVNEMLASGAVTGPKILASSIGAAHAVFAAAAIQSADIATLQADKISTGNLTVQMSITTGSLVMSSGSNTVTLSSSLFRSQGSNHRVDLFSGQVVIQSLASSLNSSHSSGYSGYTNSSGLLVADLQSAGGDGQLRIYTSGQSLRITANSSGIALVSCGISVGGTTAIDASRNADFANCRVRSQLRMDGLSAGAWSQSNWIDKFPVYTSGGSFAGWVPVSV
jgi:hypothetical protein